MQDLWSKVFNQQCDIWSKVNNNMPIAVVQRPSQRPINTTRCTHQFIRKVLDRFHDIFIMYGEFLRFEVASNNKSTRLVIVFDWKKDTPDRTKRNWWLK